MLPNILAERYASPALRSLWSPEERIRTERRLWVSVLRAQADLGLEVSPGAVEAYERVIDEVDLASIRAREEQTRHDVKARLEEFCALAGHEEIHRGMTSRDATETVEQRLLLRSLRLLLAKAAAALHRFSDRAGEYAETVLSARTHNVPAQPTSFGRRLATYGEEMLLAAHRLEAIVRDYPARGLKGAVGTQLDLLTLFGGDEAKVVELEARVAAELGFAHQLRSPAQIYPRSLDHTVVSALVDLAAGPANLARTIRLMAGHDTAGEGFAPGQTGSTAMPHKQNPRSCERIQGFLVLLRGYASMTAGLAGEQWHEGDVACSVVRRVALPDALFAADGLLETLLSVLGSLEVFPAAVDAENRRLFPFLASTTLLMEAVRAGAGREEAHAAVKEHMTAAHRLQRAGEDPRDTLVAAVDGDARLPLDRPAVEAILDGTGNRTGRAGAQVEEFRGAVHDFLGRQDPAWREIEPGPIL